MSALRITSTDELQRLQSQRDLLALCLTCALLMLVPLLAVLYAMEQRACQHDHLARHVAAPSEQ